MVDLPTQLLVDISPTDAAAVEAWWAGLPEAARSEVAALWDERQDICLFGMAPELDGAAPPVVIGGRFVPRGEAAGREEWRAEYFEHLMNNLDLVFFEAPVVRTFHICTRHRAARAVLAAGRIPADFRCPLDRADCPLRRLLDVSPKVLRSRN